MKITDSLTLDASGLTLTRDGFLVGEAKVSRAGNVQQYYGSELGLTGDEAKKMFGVYRDPDVVFDEQSMMSLAGRPVTRGHPPGGVNADNWATLVKGQMGGVIRRDGEHVVAPMAIMDAAAAKEVAGGARALSAGYTVDVVADEGTAADGTPYQFRQAGALRFNHVAYLPDNNPRAGNTRIGDDAQPGLAPNTLEKDAMSDALKTVVLGDKAVQVAVADVAAIEAFKADAAKTIADANTAHQTAIAAKDSELAKKDAEIDALKAKIVDGAALDKLVADRAALCAVATKIAPAVKLDGLADADIKKAVVTAKLGDAAVKDKSADYINARFDILAEDAGKTVDPFAQTLKDGIQQPTNTNDAYNQMLERDRNAWQGQKERA
ncbi:MAG TPA: DUF2213 domain-containing protein [Ramlibacter sp.]